MSKVVIAPCNCKHEYQDEKYGRGMRVWNEKVAKGKVCGKRCTVCSKETSAGFHD
jgi:hypothetical protein